MKSKYMYMVMVLLFAVGIAIAGCSGGGEEVEPEAPASVEETAPAAAPVPKKEAPAAPAAESSASKMMALCEKLAVELKNSGIPSMGADQTVKACKDGMKDSTNADAADKWAAKVLKACDGKTGQDWFLCYSTTAQSAAH